ncbi:hypothetical protein MGH68_09140 [Erysipelothrix sp. D19-032]
MKRKSTFNSVMKTLILIIVVAIMGTGMIKGSKFYQNVDRNFFNFFSMMKYGLIDYPIETKKWLYDGCSDNVGRKIRK